MRTGDKIRSRLATLSKTIEGKNKWHALSDDAKKNIYSSFTGIKPEHVDLGGMTYSMLPKYVKKTMEESDY